MDIVSSIKDKYGKKKVEQIRDPDLQRSILSLN